MFVIGSHLSISKGYLHMGKEATKIGGNTFQYFTRNPRGGSMRALDVERIYERTQLWYLVSTCTVYL